MSGQVIDGRKIASALKRAVAQDVNQLSAFGVVCRLTTIRVGEDFSARVYQSRLTKVARQLGVNVAEVCLPERSCQNDVVDAVHAANVDSATSGILVLRPLPDHIAEADVFQSLAPHKDIEAVHPENAGLLALGVPRYVPSTAASVFHVLDHWLDQIGEQRSDFYHRTRIVVVGRSNNVGKPLVSLAYARQAAVESVDEWASHTHRLSSHTRRADVLICAAGVPGLIQAEHVRAGAIVLDVGINLSFDDAGRTRIVGDVDFDGVLNRVRAITPVPGGIGPVTDVWLMRSVVDAASRHVRPRLSDTGTIGWR